MCASGKKCSRGQNTILIPLQKNQPTVDTVLILKQNGPENATTVQGLSESTRTVFVKILFLNGTPTLQHLDTTQRQKQHIISGRDRETKPDAGFTAHTSCLPSLKWQHLMSFENLCNVCFTHLTRGRTAQRNCSYNLFLHRSLL